MFTSIRKYRIRNADVHQLAERVRDGFLPVVSKMPGFRAYYFLKGGPDTVITITMFDTRDEALLSNARAQDWVRENILEHVRGLPEVMIGDALIIEGGPEGGMPQATAAIR